MLKRQGNETDINFFQHLRCVRGDREGRAQAAAVHQGDDRVGRVHAARQEQEDDPAQCKTTVIAIF